MKLVLRLTQFIFILLSSSLSFAETGSLVEVAGEGPVLTICPQAFNHVYENMGLTLSTSGYEIPTSDCKTMRGTSCVFAASRESCRPISIQGLTGHIKLSICLDETAQLNCQDFAANITNYKFAVGDSNPLVGDLSAQTYTSNDGGVSWDKPRTLPNPTGSGDNTLKSISCSPSGRKCAAGGFNGNYNGLIYTNTTNPLGITTWTGPLAPSPTTSSGDTLSSIQIWAMHYAKLGRCIAVGNGTLSSGASSGTAVPLAYLSSDCTTWGAADSTVVVGPDTTTTVPVLNAVTCNTSGRQCVAVGQRSAGTTAISATTENGGSTWTVNDPPLPSGYTQAILFGVSCSSSRSRCIAVGYGIDEDSVEHAIAYTSLTGGRTWGKAEVLPTPEGYTGMRLTSISCNSSATICSAVGLLTTTLLEDPVTFTYRPSETGTGFIWTQSDITTTGVNQLNSVFCTSTGSLCTAVGPGSISDPISYSSSDAGSTWTGPVQLNAGAGLGSANLFSVGGSG
ncbi:MAG: hypothetical protein K0U37_02330 [Gammaproteobacteria bacterium]|nr:hypothetical protein [Gammaproteobacteria bacterium]